MSQYWVNWVSIPRPQTGKYREEEQSRSKEGSHGEKKAYPGEAGAVAVEAGIRIWWDKLVDKILEKLPAGLVLHCRSDKAEQELTMRGFILRLPKSTVGLMNKNHAPEF